jgi:hypothetical protein
MRRFIFVMPVFCSLLLSWLLALRLVVLRLLVLLWCHLPHLRLFLLLLVVRVVVFIVLTVVAMDMWRHSATGRRKLRLAVLHRALVVLVLEDMREVLLVQRQRRFSCCFVALRLSTSLGVVGTVTQSSAPIGSATASQSSTLGPPTAPSPGAYSWYLDSGASFHMTPPLFL